jgi:hypothetical protein
MARGRKVKETTTSSSPTSSSSTPSSDINEEKEMEANMIKKFGKQGRKEIKNFWTN